MTPTGSSVPGPSADPTVAQALINKVSPRVLGIVLLVGIALLTSTTLYAVFSGRSVDFWGLKIGGGPGPDEVKGGPSDANQKRCAAREADLQAARNQSRDLEHQLAGAITSRDLSFWSGGKTKQEIVAICQTEADHPGCDDEDMAECLFAKIENRIGKSGGYIDPKSAPKDTVMMVQKALQSIKAFDGDIDGNGERTWQALMRFQQGKRIRNNDNAYEGLCGMKTLARIRAVHKQLADET
jgi:hypothetical protein